MFFQIDGKSGGETQHNIVKLKRYRDTELQGLERQGRLGREGPVHVVAHLPVEDVRNAILESEIHQRSQDGRYAHDLLSIEINQRITEGLQGETAEPFAEEMAGKDHGVFVATGE